MFKRSTERVRDKLLDQGSNSRPFLSVSSRQRGDRSTYSTGMLFAFLVLGLVLGAGVVADAAWAATGDQLFKVTAIGGSAGDNLGYSSSVSGNVAIFGARAEDGPGSDSGAAYLMSMTTGGQLFKLTAADAAAGDWFGHSVAISGNVAIVGAPQNDDAGTNSGSAYLFDVTTGAQLFKLVASDAAGSDAFGFSVGISGNLAIVGASSDEIGGLFTGSAYVFDVTTGAQLFKLVASDGDNGDRFGKSVSIDGTTAIIGADGDDDLGTTSGAAYLFDASTGNQLNKLLAADGAGGDGFGISVSINGNRAVVGSNFDDDAGVNSGSAYVFDVTTGSQVVKLTASDGATSDQFGLSVGISGNTAVVGSFFDDDAGSNSGSAYLFDATTGAELAKMTALDAAADDRLGFSVSIDGNTAVAGAVRENNQEGAGYVFDASVTAPPTLVTFRMEDQGGTEIPNSDFRIDPGTGLVNVATGSTLSLDAGTYSVILRPGINGNANSNYLTRTENLVVSGATQDASFEWKTEPFTATIEDQASIAIANSQWLLQNAPGGPNLSAIQAVGATLMLPVTDDPAYPSISGSSAGGYAVRLYPGINGFANGGYLFRTHQEEVPIGGAAPVFVWPTESFSPTIQDQSAAAIPNSQWLLLNAPGGPVLSTTQAAGASLVLPVTEDPSFPGINGSSANGFVVRLFPGLTGTAQAGILYRSETVEVPVGGTSPAYTWQTEALTVTLEDQTATAIPASEWRLLGPPAGPQLSPYVASGTSLIVPVTEDASQPATAGPASSGYLLWVAPGLNGNANGGKLYRGHTVAVPVGGLSPNFTWETATGTLHIVDASEAEIVGSSVSIPFAGTFTSGDPITLPVTEDPSAPTHSGTLAGGYTVNFVSPAGGPFTMKLNPGELFDPLFVDIGGSDYGLRFNLPPMVTFRMEDQSGTEIPNSDFRIDPGTGLINVATGATLALDPGTYSVILRPGINGNANSNYLTRTETLVVTGGAQAATFEWKTEPFTTNIEDQTATGIPNSQWLLQNAPGGPNLGAIQAAGATLMLPVTDDPAYPSISGSSAGGYAVRLYPGINGFANGGYLFRTEQEEVPIGGASPTFVWQTESLSLTIEDQAAVDIPNSQWLLLNAPGGPVLSTTQAAGASLTLPVTDDPAFPGINGSSANGFVVRLFPGINGTAQAGNLYRTETVEVPIGGTSPAYTWQTEALAVTLEDQNATAIPASEWRLLNPPGGPTFGGYVASGAPLILPVTEDASHPATAGSASSGYLVWVAPGLNGNANGGKLYRGHTVAVPVGGVSPTFTWETATGTLHIVDATETEVAGSSASIPFAATFSTGDLVTLPVTEDASVPTHSGTLAGGYTVNFISPAGGPFTMELNPGELFDPLFVDIGGNDYGLRFNLAQDVTVSGTVTSDCDGALSGVTVTVTDSGGTDYTDVTDGAGGYSIPGVSSGGLGTVAVTLPGGYAANTPAGGSTSVNLSSDASQDFLLDCIFVSVSGTVTACSGALAGVTVDLDLDPLNPAAGMETTTTDGAGAYSFTGIRWSTEDAEVSIVVPLGYEALIPVDGEALADITANVIQDFTLDCLDPDGQARSKGYWKHQAKVYVKNKGNAQESEIDMTTNFPAEVFNHFYENELNSIEVEGVTFMDDGGNDVPLDLATIHATLSIKGNAGMEAKARQQYLAMLLNIASGKLLTSAIISDDGGTASQALQQVAAYINDGDPSNDETAKDIGDTINNAQLVAAGVIDLNLTSIAYNRGLTGGTQLLGALQNPFQSMARIQYALGQESSVQLVVFDVRGRQIRTLVDGHESAGEYTVTWDGRDDHGRTTVAGIYYLRLRAGQEQHTQTVVRLN